MTHPNTVNEWGKVVKNLYDSPGETEFNGIAIYEIRNSYGEIRAYPANDIAKDLCALTETKILLKRHISIIKRLGFDVHFTVPPVQDFDSTILQ